MANNQSIKTKDLVEISLMAALIIVATCIFQIHTYKGGYIHLGDSVLLVSVVLLGKKKSIAAAAIGMTIADISSAAYTWAPFTFFIKGIMAYIAYIILFRNKKKEFSVVNTIIAFTFAEIWMIIGYYFAGALLYSILGGGETIMQGFILSLQDIPANIVQGFAGVIIAVPLVQALKNTRLINIINSNK
jgi:Predicted membrane protein